MQRSRSQIERTALSLLLGEMAAAKPSFALASSRSGERLRSEVGAELCSKELRLLLVTLEFLKDLLGGYAFETRPPPKLPPSYEKDTEHY